MSVSLMNEVFGTLLELSVFFYVFYKLLDLEREKRFSFVLIYLGMTALVVVTNKYLLGYGAFIYLFALLFIVRWFADQSLFKVLFVFVSTMIGLLLSEIVLIPVVGLFYDEEIVVTLISLAIANGIAVVLVHFFEEWFKQQVQKYQAKYINFIAIHIFLYAFIYKVIWDYDESIVRENMIYFGVAMVLLLSVNYLVHREVANVSERNKALEVEEQMRETLDQMISEIRSKQHEYKNNLTTIIGILETNPPDVAGEKITEFLEDVYIHDAFDSKLLNIDRDIVKAVLFMKKSEAQGRGIEFRYNCINQLKDMKLLDYELSLVMNNLINNAFEAVERDDEPIVELEIGYEPEGLYFVQTKNAGHHINPAHLTKLTEKNFSTKSPDRKNRGFGLWTVKNIAKKNNGKVDIHFDRDDIVIKVLFS